MSLLAFRQMRAGSTANGLSWRRATDTCKTRVERLSDSYSNAGRCMQSRGVFTPPWYSPPSSNDSKGRSRGITHLSDVDGAVKADGAVPTPQPIRQLYPKVRLCVATSADEGGKRETRENSETNDAKALNEPPATLQEGVLERKPAPPASTVLAMSHLDTVAPALNPVQEFLEEVQHQVDHSRQSRNASIPYPDRPDALVPVFRRIKRSQKLEWVVPDEEYPKFPNKNPFLALPPPRPHPWVKNTPIGHIIHGDGHLGVVGTGEVGFENGDEALFMREQRKHWRGLQHHSVLQRKLPQNNGKVLQDLVVKHSFALMSRGVFATRDIAKGEMIMIVQSTAQSVGVKGEIRRLEEMCIDILRSTYEHLLNNADGEGDAMHDFLFHWILTGQPSSLLEHWASAATERVIREIGGPEVLERLELHPIHIARLAAILDLNSFLVESYYAERKGMAYFPEAGFLNHSCVPNTTYDILPEHAFKESEYCLDGTPSQDEEEPLGPEAEVEFDNTSDTTASAEEKGATSRMAKKQERTCGHSSHKGKCVATSPLDDLVGNSSTHMVDYQQESTVEGKYSNSLTEYGAPVYLFCCRATKPIKSGEEILISYIPPGWSFDNRQYVLHDRYRFWCKCPKCSPTLDKRYARIPKLVVVMVLFTIMLQMLLISKRSSTGITDEEEEWFTDLSEKERRELLQERGIDVNDMRMEPCKAKKKPQGLFEWSEQRQLDDINKFDGQIVSIKSIEQHDMYARKR